MLSRGNFPFFMCYRLDPGGQTMRTRTLWTCIALIAGLCASARGQFVGGGENFNGTDVDSNTWTPYSFGAGSVTVAGGFADFHGQYYLSTRTLTVGVGDVVTARV